MQLDKSENDENESLVMIGKGFKKKCSISIQDSKESKQISGMNETPKVGFPQEVILIKLIMVVDFQVT